MEWGYRIRRHFVVPRTGRRGVRFSSPGGLGIRKRINVPFWSSEDKAGKEGEAGNPLGCRCSLTQPAEAAAGQKEQLFSYGSLTTCPFRHQRMGVCTPPIDHPRGTSRIRLRFRPPKADTTEHQRPPPRTAPSGRAVTCRACCVPGACFLLRESACTPCRPPPSLCPRACRRGSSRTSSTAPP